MTSQTLRHRPGTLARALLIAAMMVLAACTNTAQTVSVDDPRVPDLFTEPQPIAPEKNEDASVDIEKNSDANVSTKPAGLVIETLGVAMPVVAVGLEDDGAMEIPEDVMTAGHYNPDGMGVMPGSPGTAVFAAHVDSRKQGRGALYELSTLTVNDLIGVADPDGTTRMWRVTEVVTYRKEVLPLDALFTFAGPSRIAVITCGGEFDRSARSYSHNIVVLAEPTNRDVN